MGEYRYGRGVHKIYLNLDTKHLTNTYVEDPDVVHGKIDTPTLFSEGVVHNISTMLLYDEDEETGSTTSPMFVGMKVSAMNETKPPPKNLLEEYDSVHMLRRISRCVGTHTLLRCVFDMLYIGAQSQLMRMLTSP